MNKKFLSFLVLFTVPAVILAEVDISGYVQTDTRLFSQKDFTFYWNENRFDLKLEASPLDDAQVHVEFWGRNFGFPAVNSSSDLMRPEKDKISPWSLLFREAYVDLYGFLAPNLDIRVGLQRISWGTADKLNPTDNLNPDDLEDIWDFGRHLGSTAIKASYYLDDFTLTAVYIPVFTPATLPIEEWAGALSTPVELPPGLSLRNLSDKIITPEKTLKESSTFGFKIEKNFFGYDFSLSYFYGRDDIPLANKVNLTPVDLFGITDVEVELVYPRIQVLGLDVAGALGKIGIWVEGALFFPEEVEMATDLTDLGMGIQTSVALDKPYFRYIVGADYSFKGGWYINGQYLHGFIHERKEEEMGDYFFFGIEKKLLRDKLKITLGSGAEIRSFTEIKDNYAFLLSPEIAYYPFDNAEVSIGYRFIDGKESVVFGRVKDNDEVYFKAKYSF
jgi:hypothetical protein